MMREFRERYLNLLQQVVEERLFKATRDSPLATREFASDLAC